MASGKELFNATQVKNKMEEIQNTIQDFSKTINEINELVDDLIQNGEASAVNGSFGVDLYNTWDQNKSTIDDFEKNFNSWVAVVSVIEATNKNLVENVRDIYRNGSATQNGAAIASGNMTSSERLSGTSLSTWTSYEEAAHAGFSNIRTRNEFIRGGSDKETYGTYDNYLQAMFNKYNK